MESDYEPLEEVEAREDDSSTVTSTFRVPEVADAYAGRPAGVRGDVVRERWPDFRLNEIRLNRQFLIRLVCTCLHRRGRRPTLPRDTARG